MSFQQIASRKMQMRGRFVQTLDRTCTVKPQSGSTAPTTTGVKCSLSSKAGNSYDAGVGAFTITFEYGVAGLVQGTEILIDATPDGDKPALRMMLFSPVGDPLLGERWTCNSAPNYGTAVP
jgi:hypothetical protein